MPVTEFKITDIPTTATTPATDDYLELGGSTNGSRKILSDQLAIAHAKRYGSPLNVKWYGAVGDGVTDDTVAIQSAVDAATALPKGQVFFPTGRYLTDTINLGGGLSLLGAGREASVLVQRNLTGSSYGTLYSNSGAAGTFLDGLCVADLGIDGRVDSLGFSEFKHLISLHGVRDVVIERVNFIGFRGDGLYLGSGVTGGDERHNYNVTVTECVFDGVNNENRNGISVIDCRGFRAHDNLFKRCTKTTMPGAIDFEPDAYAFHVIRDVVVSDNTFRNVNGAVAAVAVYVPSTVTTPPSGFVFSGNLFESVPQFAFVVNHAVAAAKGSADEGNAVSIRDNVVIDSGAGFYLLGIKGANVTGNTFVRLTSPSRVAGAAAATECRDTVLRDNSFVKCATAGASGLILFNVVNILVARNAFDDCGSGAPGSYSLSMDNGSSSGVTIEENVFSSPTGKTTVAIVKEAAHTQDPATNCLSGNIFRNSLSISGFSAAGAFNRPDYYAAGVSWTPTLVGETTAGVQTYTTQWGRYTRTGNLVTCFFKVAISAKGGTMAGIVNIGGLPFPAADYGADAFYAGGLAVYEGLTLGAGYTQVGLFVVRTTSFARLLVSGTAVSGINLVEGSIAASTYFIGSFSYPAA